jgi:prevent-host-death family protein
VSDAPHEKPGARPASAGPKAADPAATAGSRAGRAREPGRPAARAEKVDRREAPPSRKGAAPAAAKRIGIRELRQHASVYVDLAEKGYTVDITNRGRLVARLVPVSEPGSPLERLIAAGIVEPPEEPGGAGDLEPYPAPTSSGHDAGLSGRARRQDRDPGRQQDRGRGGPQDPGAGGQRGRR